MKRTIVKKSVLLLFFFTSFLFAWSQQNILRPYQLDKTALKNALDYERTNQHQPALTSPVVIRVFFRIVDPVGGINPDITEDQIAQDFKHLVGAYSKDNICFINMGYDHLYNTALDTFNTRNDSYKIFLSYGLPNCITVFYIDKLGGQNNSSGGGYSGITYGIPSAWSIIAKSYTGKGVVEHELGHCFGLLHTFDFVNGNGLENIDGTNGSTSADLIADTKADPYAFANENASSKCFATTNGGCTYSGSCTDLKGRSDYSPPYTNLMSYWCSAFYPSYVITTGQYTRVTSFLSTSSALLATESPQTAIDGPYSISSGYHMNSAVSTLTTSGAVLITGTAITSLGAGQTVFLEPGFDAVPGTGGQVFIRHSFCDTTSNGYTFSGNTTTASIQSDKINSATNQKTDLFVYPNPATSSVQLSFYLTANASNAEIKIYDMNMRQVKNIPLGMLNTGAHTISADIYSLNAGLYFIMLYTPNEIMKTKVIVVR